MRYAFHPAAAIEHLESVASFEEARAGLGALYLAEFEMAMRHVCDAPHHFPVERPPDIRGARLRRFPYKVIFRVREDRIQVLAVAHDRRRARYWYGRH